MKIHSVIVGLGNIGNEYINTRHNIGFHIVDSLLSSFGLTASISPLNIKRIPGEVWKLTYKNSVYLLCMPATYMNNSGMCVAPLLSYYTIPPSSLLVIHDELDIPLGSCRMKIGGGDAGHNGLRSITSLLGTPEYTRLRVGIGRPTHSAMSIANWVLSKFTNSEQQILSEITPHLLHAIIVFMQEGFKKAQNEIKR